MKKIAVCEECWKERQGDRVAARLKVPVPASEPCGFCRAETSSGIYMPALVLGDPSKGGAFVPTGLRQMDISNFYVPWDVGVQAPVTVCFASSGKTYVPIFERSDAVGPLMALLGVESYEVRQIRDESLFLQEVPRSLEIMINPKMEEGALCFGRLLRD